MIEIPPKKGLDKTTTIMISAGANNHENPPIDQMKLSLISLSMLC